MKPRLLDLFCGAGGAAMGYWRSGFDVTGVDSRDQPRFPFDFIQGDALAYCREHGHEYDVIHASPPCQAHTQMSARWRGKGGQADAHPDLISATREALQATGVPWVIENVVGARRAMRSAILLHGGMFGLGVYRPRLFESNVALLTYRAPRPANSIGVYGDKPNGRWLYRNGATEIRAAGSLAEASKAMGIEWMHWYELTQAIPPAYTEFIGRQLMGAM